MDGQGIGQRYRDDYFSRRRGTRWERQRARPEGQRQRCQDWRRQSLELVEFRPPEQLVLWEFFRLAVGLTYHDLLSLFDVDTLQQQVYWAGSCVRKEVRHNATMNGYRGKSSAGQMGRLRP